MTYSCGQCESKYESKYESQWWSSNVEISDIWPIYIMISIINVIFIKTKMWKQKLMDRTTDISPFDDCHWDSHWDSHWPHEEAPCVFWVKFWLDFVGEWVESWRTQPDCY